MTLAGGDGTVNDRILIVHVGETTVLAQAKTGRSATPEGPDVNPLVDEATFLSVLEQLRPYPQ
jgi:hypothetical protein